MEMKVMCDVSWTFAKALERDIPKLLCHTRVYTPLPSCGIITTIYKHNVARAGCGAHVDESHPSRFCPFH